MSEFDTQIRQLVTEACKHEAGSPIHQKNLTQVIRRVSGKLWKENKPYYTDAVQQTWMYFCRHVCQRYDPDLASVTTWLNAYLKRRLQDFYIAERDRQQREISNQVGEPGDEINVIERIADHRGDVPPILDQVRAWAEADLDGELRNLHIRNRPDVTCQMLILRRLPPETSWKDLSEEFGLAIPTLSAFYQRQCLPRLRNFGKSEGYV